MCCDQPRLTEDVAFLSQLRADQGPPASTREGLNTAGALARKHDFTLKRHHKYHSIHDYTCTY